MPYEQRTLRLAKKICAIISDYVERKGPTDNSWPEILTAWANAADRSVDILVNVLFMAYLKSSMLFSACIIITTFILSLFDT